MDKPIHFCAVRGLVAHLHMCLSVGCGSDAEGRKACHRKEPCEHQRLRDEPPAAHQPAKEPTK